MSIYHKKLKIRTIISSRKRHKLLQEILFKINKKKLSFRRMNKKFEEDEMCIIQKNSLKLS